MSGENSTRLNGDGVADNPPYVPVKSSLNLSPYDVISSDSWRKSAQAGIVAFNTINIIYLCIYICNLISK